MSHVSTVNVVSISAFRRYGFHFRATSDRDRECV